jgi:hypothetical protein
MAVSFAVPSEFHSSLPCTPSSAVNQSLPRQSVRTEGEEGPCPGLMSATMWVLAASPLVDQSSVSWTPSVPLKE